MNANKLDTSRNQTTEEIKEIVKKEFQKIDKETWWGDDDKEIYQAGFNICKQYINEFNNKGD